MRKDKSRHNLICGDAETRATFYKKTLKGCAALFRISCGIYENPAQAYAYALLHRLECPSTLMKEIPISMKKKRSARWLFDVFTKLNYDVYTYVDVVRALLFDKVPEEKRARVMWQPIPEVMATIQLRECSVLRKLIVDMKTRDEDACLAIMLMSQTPADIDAASSIRLLNRVHGLYENRYDGMAHRGLRDLYQDIVLEID